MVRGNLTLLKSGPFDGTAKKSIHSLNDYLEENELIFSTYLAVLLLWDEYYPNGWTTSVGLLQDCFNTLDGVRSFPPGLVSPD